MSQGGVIWCLPTHAHSHTHTHTLAYTQLQSLEGDGDMRLCCTLRVKSRISWRLFIMHKVPSGKELAESQPQEDEDEDEADQSRAQQNY